jgi:DNA-binding PadR family transcriptional regulator
MAFAEIEPRPLHELNGFQRDIMTVVDSAEDDSDRVGLRIKEALDQEYGDINHGRLYPNLDALVDDGLLAKAKIDGRTNSYGLTLKGKKRLDAHRAWMAE